MSVRGVAVLMAASLIAPGVLLADTLAGGTDDGVVIAVFSAVFFVLVLSRVGGVVARYGRTVERERALREVGAALLVAEDERQVVSAVCAAVDRLAASGPHRCEVLLSADAGAADGAPSRLVPAAELAAEAAVVARGYRTAVVCPLVVEERRDGGRPVGLLVVAADDPVLFTLRGALEVLAAQAALAIERLVLARAVSERDNEAYFRTLVHNSHDVVLIVDDGGRVRYASPSARSVLGPAPVQGLPVADLVDPQDREDTASPLVAVARGETPPEGAPVCRVLRRDGDRIEVQVAHRDLRDDPTVRGIVLTLRDVTEQRRLERELTHRASHDALTGLPNRVLFRERVDTAIGALPGRRAVVGVLLLDLDDFKLVNDTLGHTAGDELLIAIAGRLSSVLRVVDTPARLGGDEFAVLIEDADTEADVELVAERVVEALRIDASTGGPACSVSVGVAVAAAGRAHGSAELLRRADLALYAAKSAGKGQWRRYAPDLHLAAVDRVGVRTELKGALADGQFELRYQPVVELDSGVTAGLEALVRWHHPRRGTLAPGEFVRVAEETGLILPLGSWVLDRALSDIAAWRRLSPTAPMLHVGVNVSARQVRSPGFVGQVLDALARRGVPPGAVLLEITETALLADDVQVADDLADLRAHGVRIALDDFGTGYSSLDYLRVHPVDVVKIDRSFIDGMDRDPRQADLVAAMVELARAIGLEVIAEGVETAAQRAALVRAGCRLGQGFLYSAAIPADDVVDWLRTSSRAGALDGAGATPDPVAALAPPDHSRAPWPGTPPGPAAGLAHRTAPHQPDARRRHRRGARAPDPGRPALAGRLRLLQLPGP
jgi:diguanylate cyclase (GGDEF)-like protein/PAS domain S-box-containing protein